MNIPIHEIKINPGRREALPEDVNELAKSISEVGLLNPITIDRDHTLIAGLHRLEAAKQLGWTEIACTVSSLEGLQAELAEIDENFIRSDLSAVEYGDLLLRRKEIYESLHPETKNGGDKKSEKIRSAKCTSDFPKSFVEDTAEKLGVNPSTVRRRIQTAKNLTPEAKAIIRNTDTKISKKNALKLSRLEPEQQVEAASQLAAKEIRSVDEYQKPPAEPLNLLAELPPPPVSSSGQEEKRFVTFAENVADLKDPNKDCSCTPDFFLAELAAYIQKFTRGIAWYTTPDYSVVFPALSPEQVCYIRKLMDSVCAAVNQIFDQIEGSAKA